MAEEDPQDTDEEESLPNIPDVIEWSYAETALVGCPYEECDTLFAIENELSEFSGGRCIQRDYRLTVMTL